MINFDCDKKKIAEKTWAHAHHWNELEESGLYGFEPSMINILK